jgi:YfiH family protein
MMQKQANNNSFYFGNARKTIQEIQANLDMSSLIILDQVHGNEGRVITKENSHMPFKSAQGDFLITNEKNIGLGVLTADCLPIIFIDAEHNAVGIAHAGWRGSVQDISSNVLHSMEKFYGTSVNDVSVFFGPCAKVCCYQVQKDFVIHVGLLALTQRGDNLFFDLPAFNKHQLLLTNISYFLLDYHKLLLMISTIVVPSAMKIIFLIAGKVLPQTDRSVLL